MEISIPHKSRRSGHAVLVVVICKRSMRYAIVLIINILSVSRIAKKYSVFVKSELTVGNCYKISIALEVKEFIPVVLTV